MTATTVDVGTGMAGVALMVHARLRRVWLLRLRLAVGVRLMRLGAAVCGFDRFEIRTDPPAEG